MARLLPVQNCRATKLAEGCLLHWRSKLRHYKEDF